MDAAELHILGNDCMNNLQCRQRVSAALAVSHPDPAGIDTDSVEKGNDRDL